MYNFITLSVILLTNFYTIKSKITRHVIYLYILNFYHLHVCNWINNFFFLDTTKTYIELRNIHILHKFLTEDALKKKNNEI